jgi:hypothetical protein
MDSDEGEPYVVPGSDAGDEALAGRAAPAEVMSTPRGDARQHGSLRHFVLPGSFFRRSRVGRPYVDVIISQGSSRDIRRYPENNPQEFPEDLVKWAA